MPAGLIEAAREGDRDAIVSLLAISQPNIRRYAQRSCRAADVDDAVQEALILLDRRIGGLKVVNAFASWLFQIVIRECQRLTRRTMHTAQIDDVEDSLAFSTRPTSDLRLDVARAIESLPLTTARSSFCVTWKSLRSMRSLSLFASPGKR